MRVVAIAASRRASAREREGAHRRPRRPLSSRVCRNGRGDVHLRGDRPGLVARSVVSAFRTTKPSLGAQTTFFKNVTPALTPIDVNEDFSRAGTGACSGTVWDGCFGNDPVGGPSHDSQAAQSFSGGREDLATGAGGSPRLSLCDLKVTLSGKPAQTATRHVGAWFETRCASVRGVEAIPRQFRARRGQREIDRRHRSCLSARGGN